MKDFAKSIRTENQKVGNEAIVLKDGDVWVVLYANETKSKEFDTESEARKFAASVGNKKVGNAWTSVDEKRLNELLKKGPSKMTDEEWKEFQELNKRADQENAKALKKLGNSKVGNEYKPDIRITPADLSRNLKQAKNISEIDDIDDEIEYDLREYENAIDECKLKIKDYERSISALRMIQRDVSDARRNLK